MSRILTSALLLIITISTFAQYNLENLKMESSDELVAVNTYEKLRIYPIRCNEKFKEAHKGIGNYTNLKDAIAKKKLKVSEVNNSGTVNTLSAENKSADTIFVMAGEVVQGGKQDRVLAQDVVIPPGKKVDLSAFCVEQGRWDHKGKGGNFNGYFNVTSKEVRKAAIVEKNQSQVWNKVAETTSKNDAKSSTGTYSELAKSDKYQKELKKYLEKFKGAFKNDPNVVGVVAVTGDKVIGCDIFATNDLFNNAYDNLLHSYVTDAVTEGSDVKMGTKDVQKYLDGFLKDESKQEEEVKKNGAIYKHAGKKLHMAKF